MGSWGFITGLVLLVVNDHVLKSTFNNSLTGKLSDFAGLFIFPMFFSAIFPAFKKHIYWGTAILFTLFKSTWAEPFIVCWNQCTHLRISRVVDLTDLMALAVLPFSYKYFTQTTHRRLQIHPLPIIILAAVGFMATSRSPRVPITYNQEYVFQYPFDTLKKKIFFHPNISNNYARTEYLKLDSIEKNSTVYPPKHLQQRKKTCMDTYCNQIIYIHLEDTGHIGNGPMASIQIYPNRQLSTLKLLEIRYRYCQQSANTDDKDLLKKIFEREIIQSLNE